MGVTAKPIKKEKSILTKLANAQRAEEDAARKAGRKSKKSKESKDV